MNASFTANRAVRLLAVAITLGLLVPGLQAQDLRAPEVTDFVDFHELDEVAISPDGAWLAIVVREAPDTDRAHAERGLWILPVDGTAPPQRVTKRSDNGRSPIWSPEGRTLAFLAEGDEGQRQVFLLDVRERSLIQPRQLTTSVSGVRRFAWSPDGTEIAFLARVPKESADPSEEKPRGKVGVWILNVAEASADALTPADLGVSDLAWAPDASALALVASKGAQDRAVWVVDRESELQKLAENAGSPGTRRQILDWSPDGRTVMFAVTAPDGEVGHWIGLVPAEGGDVRDLLADFEGTIMRATWAPESGQILAQSFEGLKSHLLRIDPQTARIERLAEVLDSYPSFSATADGRTFAFRSDRPEAPADAWVMEEGNEPQRITNLNPQFEHLVSGEVREFTWHNPEDGMELQGVLVLPPDYEPDQRYPMIMQIHGGPHFHWGLGWHGDWHDWAQLLASRGYVVFLPNPRGSTGRGREFAGEIVHDLGGIDFRDLMAGVDALVDEGIADEEQMGVGGWSYGGFLTAWSITQTDRFRAAVVGAGISNLFSFAGSPGLGRGWSKSFFPDHPYADREAYEARSATAHLDNVQSPTLVVHGKRDGKISVNQAWELHNGLRYLDIETDIIVFPRAGHRLAERADRIEYLTRVADWYDEHVRRTDQQDVAAAED